MTTNGKTFWMYVVVGYFRKEHLKDEKEVLFIAICE